MVRIRVCAPLCVCALCTHVPKCVLMTCATPTSPGKRGHKQADRTQHCVSASECSDNKVLQTAWLQGTLALTTHLSQAGVGTQAHLPMNKLLWGGKRGGPGRNRELDAPGSLWECLSHMHSGLVPRALGFWETVRAWASENRQVAESSPKRHRNPKVSQGAGASMWPQGHIYSEQPTGCLWIWIHVGEVGSPPPSTGCGDADWGRQSTGLSEGGDDVTQNQNHTYAKLGSEDQSVVAAACQGQMLPCHTLDVQGVCAPQNLDGHRRTTAW